MQCSSSLTSHSHTHLGLLNKYFISEAPRALAPSGSLVKGARMQVGQLSRGVISNYIRVRVFELHSLVSCDGHTWVLSLSLPLSHSPLLETGPRSPFSDGRVINPLGSTPKGRGCVQEAISFSCSFRAPFTHPPFFLLSLLNTTFYYTRQKLARIDVGKVFVT